MTATSANHRPLSRRTPQPRSVVGGTLIGVFIGIVVGLGLAAIVAFWLMKNNPALPLPSLGHGTTDVAKDAPAKVAKADTEKDRFDFYKILPGVTEPRVQAERRPPDHGDRAVADQSKERPSDKAARSQMAAGEAPKAPTGETTKPSDKAAPVEVAKGAKAMDRFWLQAGSFLALPDADAVRARLALAGWDATVQEGSLPDKSVRYRVRLGPYDNSDELGRMKNELAKRGFDVAVIRY